MPRSIWNGTIAFGLVNVPIKLYSATESKTVALPRGAREGRRAIEHRRFCSKEDKEVPYEEVVKGYEVSGGEYVVLDKEEVGRGRRERRQGDRARALRPRGGDRSGLLRQDLLRGRAGRGQGRATGCCTRRSRKSAARASAASCSTTASTSSPSGRSMTCWRLHTLRFADEVVPGKDLDISKPQKQPAKREVDMAGKLVSSAPRPSSTRSSTRTATATRVLTLIKRQGRGQGDRGARGRGAPRRRTTCWPRSRRACRTGRGAERGARAVERLAELRTRERAGAAPQRGARPRPALHAAA